METIKRTATDIRLDILRLKQDLDEMLAYKAKLPRLSLEDHECITDNYQAHLELNAEIPCLRDQIAELEKELREAE